MDLKKKKFYIINKFNNLLGSQKFPFFLVVHLNTLNFYEINALQVFCLQHDIKTSYVKLNLLKKLTKNKLFLNLLGGPTKIFFFNNISDFVKFTELQIINKKIIPLTIFWKDSFYQYPFFSLIVKEIISNNDDEDKIKHRLIGSLTFSYPSVLSQLNNPIQSFIQFLHLYSDNLKK